MTIIERPISIETTKKEYTQRAYTRLGFHAADWQPQNGFKANRKIMEAVYHAYQSLYFENPNRFLWAGLARMTVQPHYNFIKTDAYSKKYFWFTRFAMRNIHPYHNHFFFDVPFQDVTEFEHRWHWIAHEKGMWQTWIALPQSERNRLVALSNEAVIRHEW